MHTIRRSFKPLPLLLLFPLLLLMQQTRAADSPSLRALGFSNNRFQIELLSPAGEGFVFEASTNLVEWFQIQTVQPGQPVSLLSDQPPGDQSQRFYRLRAMATQLNLLRPSAIDLFQGDQELFFIEEGSGATNVVWSVNGIPGGDASVGTVISAPEAPWIAAFRAPSTGGSRSVEICATEASGSTTRHCATIRIHPRPEFYIVEPANPTTGLGRQIQFSAGAIVEGIGFVKLRRVWWKVNSIPSGNSTLGIVDQNGRYQAPQGMPASLPQSIRVGVAFSAPGPVAADTGIRLARLTVQPRQIDALTIGRAATLIPTLIYSDRPPRVLPTNEVVFATSLPGSARITEAGEVFLGLTAGRAVLSVTHPELNLSTVATANARADVRLEIREVHIPSGETVRIRRTGSSQTLPIPEIEVTRPGTILAITPNVFHFRGVFNSSGSSFQIPGSPLIKARGTGGNIVTYNQASGIIQPVGTTAIVEESSGIIQIGDQPGSGTVTFTYNDGVIQREASVMIIFSRPEIILQTRSSLSLRTNEAYITEPIRITLTLTNRLNASRYVSKTQIRLREASGASFRALIRNDASEAQQFFETTELLHQVPSTLRDPFSADNYSPFIIPGQVELEVWPGSAGKFELEASLAHDPLGKTQKVAYIIKRPSLRLPLNPALGSSLALTVPRTNILAGSWENFDGAPDEPPGVNPITRLGNAPDLLTGEELRWSLRMPDGTVRQFPYKRGELLRPWFPTTWSEPGPHGLWLHSESRPEIRTEELKFNVLSSQASGIYEHIAGMSFRPTTLRSTRTNQLAALRILSPLQSVWIPGVPVDVTLQTIDANGIPRRVGKISVTEQTFDAEPNRVDRTTNSLSLGGCSIFVLGPVQNLIIQDLVAGTPNTTRAVADPDGKIRLRVTVPAGTTAVGDIGLAFTPVIQTRLPDATLPPGNLTLEWTRRRNGSLVSQDVIAVETVEALQPNDRALSSPTLILGGRGLLANPSTLAIPSDRVRLGVSEGWLPAGSDYLVTELQGTAGWSQALASGIPIVDFGTGLTLVDQSIQGERLVVRLKADPARFSTNSSELGPRDISLRFADGSRWQTRLTVARFSLERRENQADRNLPLNAAYGLYLSRTSSSRQPDGATVFKVRSTDDISAGARIDLVLRPSIHACWDKNQNGLAESGEDLNGDGSMNELDDSGGTPFRGILPSNPVVGFARQIHPESGAIEVRRLRQTLLSPVDAEVAVFGDTTDRRRLDDSGRAFVPGPGADLLPDLVSRTANGELLMAWAGPTLVDAVRFTAFNFVTKSREIPEDPGLSLDQVRTNAQTAYEAYGSLNPDEPLSALARSPKVKNPVSVYVDHEAALTDIQALQKDPNGYFELKFYGGMLDQLFQRAYLWRQRRDVPLVQDDRVRPYQSRGRVQTGFRRASFGIDLDGVLYDPGSLNFPKPRWVDLSEHEVPPGQIIDANPNSSQLLSIPVVGSVLGPEAELTRSGLVRRIGGTSGGFVVLDAPQAGAMQVEARTPGAEFPGLHAGYLLLGKPADFIDPINTFMEDDMRDVILRREGEVGGAGGSPLVREKLVLGFTASRFAHAFAQNEDKKDAIKTSARVNTSHRVTTDPPGVEPDARSNWRISPAIVVRERPVVKTHPMDLLVTSQSDGNEGAMKLVADAVVDFAVDATAGALLASMSGGLALECTVDEFLETATAAVIDLSINYASSELLKTYTTDGRDKLIEIANSTLRSGFDVPIAGIHIPSYLEVSESVHAFHKENSAAVLNGSRKAAHYDIGVSDITGSFPNFCDLLTQPAEALKNAIKGSYSAETFGGLGSAQALGMKLAAITIPKSARIGTNGIYTASLSISRRIDVQAEEETAVQLQDLPWQEVFKSYPYCDQMSDDDFIGELQSKAGDPVAGEKASKILRDIGIKTVWRVPADARYKAYKIRGWNLPELSGLVAPGMQINNRFFGNFALRPDDTEIPVSTASLVAIGRSNENSSSRATINNPGVELILSGGVIPDPRAPR